MAVESGRIEHLGGVGIVGGTGALGRGLALRWAAAGVAVRIGSRDVQRAGEVAAAIAERLTDRPGAGAVTGATNRAVAAAEPTVVLAVPMAGLEDVQRELRDLLDGRIVVCAVNPVGFDSAGPYVQPVEGGSVAGSLAAALPGARVVAALHTVSSRELAAFEGPMDDDVAVVGDDPDACATVAALVDRIGGCRAVRAGPLRLAASLEALTPLLIAINARASVHVGVRFSRLPPEPGPRFGG